MADGGQVPSTVGSGVFLRRATGLVREVGLSDALIMNTIGMNVALGAVFLFLQAPANFPSGNMLLAIVIGTLVMAFTLLWVYSEFAAAMPRSGGDYVFVSRALHPFVGWLLSWSQGAVADLLLDRLQRVVRADVRGSRSRSTTIGAVTGHTGWITLSQQPARRAHVPGHHDPVVGDRVRDG